MSNLTITAKTDLSTLPAKVRRSITGAYAALSALEPTPARIYRAAVRVGELSAHGLSVRGIVAVLSVEGQGVLPTGKGTIERLGYVADALTGEWPDMGEDVHGIVHALYKVANVGKSADVKRAAELARKSKTAADAYTAIDGVLSEVRGAQYRALTTAPARQPAPPAPVESSESEADAETTAPASKPSTRAAGEALAGAGLLSLIAELQKRVGAKGFTPDAVALEAFDLLAAEWESRVAVLTEA